MPPRTIEGTPEEWARVAERVRERRLALGRPQGPSPSTKVWSGIETGKPENFRITENSERQICEALNWGPGCVQQLLRGEEPVETAEAVDPVAQLVAEMRAEREEWRSEMRDLRATIEDLVRRQGAPEADSPKPPAVPPASP